MTTPPLEEQLAKLTRDQEEAIDRLVAEAMFSNAALVATDPGGGKTRVAVSVLKRLGKQCVLILGPDSTDKSWRKELERQGIDLPVTRLRTREDADALVYGVPGVYFATKQLLVRWSEDVAFVERGGKRRRTFKTTGLIESFSPDMVINDEAHEGGTSGTTVTWRMLKKLKPQNPQDRYLLSLSGTPEGSNFVGAHRVTLWLWGDKESTWVDNSVEVWKRKWCVTEFDPFNKTALKVLGEQEPGAYYQSLPCVLTWDVPSVPVDDRVVDVELYPAQREAYDSMKKFMIAWIGDEMLTTKFPIAQRTRMRQATLGMFSLSSEGEVTFDKDCESSKIDVMLSRILPQDFEGEPAVIFTNSRSFGEVLVYRLESAGYTVGFWSGGLSTKKKDALLEAFQAGSIQYIVMVISAGGTGTDGLQAATRNMLYMSSDDSWVKQKQSKARVARIGGVGGTVRIRRLIATNTLDSGILDREIESAVAAKKRLLALQKKNR